MLKLFKLVNSKGLILSSTKFVSKPCRVNPMAKHMLFIKSTFSLIWVYQSFNNTLEPITDSEACLSKTFQRLMLLINPSIIDGLVLAPTEVILYEMW